MMRCKGSHDGVQGDHMMGASGSHDGVQGDHMMGCKRIRIT